MIRNVKFRMTYKKKKNNIWKFPKTVHCKKKMKGHTLNNTSQKGYIEVKNISVDTNTLIFNRKRNTNTLHYK